MVVLRIVWWYQELYGGTKNCMVVLRIVWKSPSGLLHPVPVQLHLTLALLLDCRMGGGEAGTWPPTLDGVSVPN
jgi:hypothetical protein